MERFKETGRFSRNFRELIERVKEAEIEKGNLTCSDTTATEIIYRRIMKAGGLKEN